MRRIFTLLLIVMGGFLRVQAQTYPVQATTQLLPPYSLFLADYVRAGSERLTLNVYLADIARPSLDVRFRLRIVGQGITLETKAEYRPAPVQLQGGVPLRLVSTDLADYFNPNNLNFQGISRAEFNRTGKLPEGAYQFCFEVLEYNRGVKISGTACAMAWLILNDPPIINLPANNAKLTAQDPQNVLLQWTPRHTGSPNSAFNTEYDIRMVEVWPSTRNPNDAVLSSPAIFETTTTSTAVLYGPAETPLEPGRRYAFRIRARGIAGMDEIDLFKNNGYSEVFTFVYGDACDLPTGISAASIGTTRFSLSWTSLFNHTGFRVRYREMGTANWYENRITLNSSEINGLKPGTAYEYQVAATCGFYDGKYATVARVTTEKLPEVEYACGVPIDAFTLDPALLTGSLKVGDIIQAGDFDVKLTKVSGGNGVFTGEGVIEVPYFNKAKVKTEFTGISVNKEMRMVNGYFNVTGAAVDVIPQGVTDFIEDLNETLDDIEGGLRDIEENMPVDFDPESFVADTLIDVKDGIQSVYKDDDGSIVIVDSNGNTQTLPPGTTAAIKDSKGKGYLVDSKGNIHKTTADVATKAGNRELNLMLKFVRNTDSRYGLDGVPNPALAEDYETLKSGYAVSWKSVPAGETDAVTAILGDAKIDKTKVRYEMGGAPVSASPTDGQSTKVFIQGMTEGEQGLLATYAPTDTGKVQVLGKLNVVTYGKISHDLVIVPVNGATLPAGLNDRIIQDSLNAIYGQAVVDWKVSVATGITVLVPDAFDDGGTAVLSNYTNDMKAVIRAYGQLQDEKYYLFLIKHSQSARTRGYMPRGKEAGFIFLDPHGSDRDALVRSMAHELGHGAFNLHHIFDEPNFKVAEGSTKNLMDYPAGNRLFKFQWDKMRFPDIVVGLFEEDEDGALAAGVLFEDVTLPDNIQTGTIATTCDQMRFLTPNNKIIDLTHLKSKIKSYQVMNGRLQGFTKTDNSVFTYARSFSYKDIQKTSDNATKKVTGQYDEIYYVCFSCIEEKTSLVSDVVEAYGSTTTFLGYSNVPKTYQEVIGKDKIMDCKAGESVVRGYDAAKGVFICEPTTDADCTYDPDNGDASGNGNVFNFTGQPMDIAFLKKLLLGDDVRMVGKNKDQRRHTLKAVLFITDKSSFAAKKDFIENYKAKEGFEKIWIHLGDNGWEIKSALPGNLKSILDASSVEAALGLKCPGTDSNGKSVYKMEDFNSPLQAAFTSLDMIATAYYELFDALAAGIRKARVPEYVWNCDKPDKYEPVYAYVYRFITLPLAPFKTTLLMIGGEQLARAVEAENPTLAAELRKLSDGRAEFAFVCGVWNGLVETIASVPEIGKYLFGALSCEGRRDFGKFWDQLKKFEKEGPDGKVECAGVWCAISTGFKDQFSGSCQIGEMGGEVAFIVIVSLVDPAAAEALVGKTVATAVKIIQYCDEFADKFNPATWALRVAAKGVKIVRKTSNKVFGRFVNGDLVARTIDGELLRVPMNRVTLEETADGLIANVTDASGNKVRHVLAEETLEIVDVADEALHAAYEDFRKESRRMLSQASMNPFGDAKFMASFLKLSGIAAAKGVRDFAVFLNSLPDDIQRRIREYYQQAEEYFNDRASQVVDLSRLQRINGKYPINAEDFAGRTYSFDLSQNPVAERRLTSNKKYTAQDIAERRAEYADLHVRYPDGVRFTAEGFPDFSPHRYTTPNGQVVEVDIQRLNPDPAPGVKGSSGSQVDMARANEQMRAIDPNWVQPDGYTWHHIENSTRLTLVPTDLHEAVRHSGGRSTYGFDGD